MLDEPTFLQAIGADPDDDGPRLLFADFLDEKGDAASVARAEFIRVQCALNSLAEGDPARTAIRAREKALLEANWRTWIRPACQALGEPLPTGPVRQPTSRPERYSIRWLDPSYRQSHFIEQAWSDGGDIPYFHSCQFRRGFIAHVALVAKEYRSAQHVARLWERLPLDGLTLAHFETATITQILNAIDGTRMRSLELIAMPDVSVECVCLAANLGPIPELVLRGIEGRRSICEMIGSSKTFQQLRALVVVSCHLDDMELTGLLESRFADRLEHLEIVRCDLSHDFARVVAHDQSFLAKIRYLDLTENRVSEQGFAALRQRLGDKVVTTPSNHPWPWRYYQ